MAKRKKARGRRNVASERPRAPRHRGRKPNPKIRRTFLHNLTRLTRTAHTNLECKDTRHAIIAHHERGDITTATRLRLLSALERKKVRRLKRRR